MGYFYSLWLRKEYLMLGSGYFYNERRKVEQKSLLSRSIFLGRVRY